MAKDWSKLYRKYRGLWVALADDEVTVLGVGKTVRESVMATRKKSDKTPFLTRVPETLSAYVGLL